MTITDRYSESSEIVLFQGDCMDMLSGIPDESVQLFVTSPPYNIGKVYESKLLLEQYLKQQATVISKCVQLLRDGGSICWQVGNHVPGPQEILPLDIALYPLFAANGLHLRNRVVWHFEHGLHCSKRLSGRHETILWFTKGKDYRFNLDPIRVPQKYPGKRHYRGPNIGKYSGNPLGKNPGDVWRFPNVKWNHPEKTIHPCQFPVELVERLVLSLTEEGDLVVDPYLGVGSTAVAAVTHKRRVAGAEIVSEYMDIARERVRLAKEGRLKTRPMNHPVYEPVGNLAVTRRNENEPYVPRKTSRARGGREPSPDQPTLL